MQSHQLGKAIANRLGYVEQMTFLPSQKVWRPEKYPKLLKGDLIPQVASSPALISVGGKRWVVQMYVWQDDAGVKPNVVGIRGNPADTVETMEKISDLLPPEIWRQYQEKATWLNQNPMYQERVGERSTKAKISPSQLTA